MISITRKHVIFLTVLIIAVGVFGINGKSRGENSTGNRDLHKPVKVKTGSYEVVSTELDYVGVVNSKEYIKYSSEIHGKINEIFVEKGQYIEPGDKLFEIDKSNLQLAFEAGELKVKQSVVELGKAEDSMNYLKNNLDKIYELYKSGGASKNSYDDIKLKYDVALKNFENAKSTYELAKISFEKNKSDFDNGIIKAKKDGVVSKIIIKAGEMTGVGTPVIVVRDNSYVINIGVSKEDIEDVRAQNSAKVDIDKECFEADILEIDEVPDELTGLYTVQIQLKEGDYVIGKMGKVIFNIDEKRGVKVPLSSIGVEEYDYVFIKNDGKAEKHRIEIIGIYKDFVLIDGIEENEQIIIEGMRALNDGDLIRTLK